MTCARNVLALLSLERYKDRDRLQPDAVQRLYNRIDDEVRSALRPYGYYEPVISSSLSGPDKDQHWHVKISDRARRAGADRQRQHQDRRSGRRRTRYSSA